MGVRRSQGAPPEHRDHRRKVGRQGRAEFSALPRARVDEAEVHGVESHARRCDRILRGVAVDRIAENGVVEVREVDTDLVRPPGAELGLDEGRRAESLQRLDGRVRRPATGAGGESGATRAGTGTADAAVHLGLAAEVAGDERLVPPGHGMGPELALQVLGCGMVAGKHHHARGVAVEAVDDVDAAGSAAAFAELDDQAGEHRVLLAVDGGVDEHARWLVDHDDVVVEVEHRDARAGGARRATGQARLVGHDRAGAQAVTRVGDDLAIDGGMTDQDLPLGPGERGPQDRLQPAGQADLVRATAHARTIPSSARAGRC